MELTSDDAPVAVRGRVPYEFAWTPAYGQIGKTVTLKIEGLKPVHHLVIKYKIRGADGAAINQELDYTINKIP